jgi:hypothetical protein
MALGAVISAIGCGGDNATAPILDEAHAYWTLQLNENAVVLALTAPYDTIQLTATPLSALGTPIERNGSVTYRATDSSVTVSPTGLVTAHYVTRVNRTTDIIAALRDSVQGVTHEDTVRFVVTATPNPPVTFSMQPADGDSAKRPLNTSFAWPVRSTNAAGTSLCSTTRCTLSVNYRSSNPAVADINAKTGAVSTTKDTGQVVFTARTRAYGVSLRDSVIFRIGFMTKFNIIVGKRDGTFFSSPIFLPKSITLGVGSVVNFLIIGGNDNGDQVPVYMNGTGPVTITFTKPETVDSAADIFFGSFTGSGNVSFDCDSVANPTCASPDEFSKARRFPIPGTYEVHYSVFPADTFYIKIESD